MGEDEQVVPKRAVRVEHLDVVERIANERRGRLT